MYESIGKESIVPNRIKSLDSSRLSQLHERWQNRQENFIKRQESAKISAELLDKSSSAGDKDCSSNVGSIKEVERPSAQEAPRAGSLLDPEISYGGSARHKILPKKPVANGFLRQPLQTESDVKENTGHLKLLLAKLPKEPVTAGYPGDPVADKKE